MGIVDSRVHRDRRARADILIALLVEHVRQLRGAYLHLVLEHMIMRWTSSSLNRPVGVEIEVPLVVVRNVTLDQSSRKWIAVVIAVAPGREEADMVTL